MQISSMEWIKQGEESQKICLSRSVALCLRECMCTGSISNAVTESSYLFKSGKAEWVPLKVLYIRNCVCFSLSWNTLHVHESMKDLIGAVNMWTRGYSMDHWNYTFLNDDGESGMQSLIYYVYLGKPVWNAHNQMTIVQLRWKLQINYLMP